MSLMSIKQAQIVDPLLTEVILGYEPSEFCWIKLFPRIGVNAAIGKYAKFGQEIYVETDAKRQPGEDKAEVSLAVSSDDYACQTYDLEGKLPKETYDAAIAIGESHGRALEAQTAQLAYAKILRQQEVEAATLATTASNYASDHKITLAGSSQWSHADCDPISQFDTAKDVIQIKTDKWANTLVTPWKGFKSLLNNPIIVERYKHTMTPEQVGSKGIEVQAKLLGYVLGIDNVFVAQAPVKNPQTAAISRIGGDNAVLAYVPPEESGRFTFKPAFGYRFHVNGYPVMYEVDYRKKNNSYYYPVGDYYDLKLTDANAGYLFSDVTA